MHFWLPYTNTSLRGNFTNDSVYGSGKTGLTDEQLQKIEFHDSTSFRAQLRADFSHELDGFESFSWYFHSREHDQVQKYNNWNFTTAKLWDSVEEGFWFADNTTALWRTMNYVVGKQQVKGVTLKLEPNRYQRKGKGDVKDRFLGIPISYND